MSQHDKNKQNAHQGSKQLNPLFGAYCATQAFSDKAASVGNRHVHMEAYMDDPLKQTWTVSKVVRKSETGLSVVTHAKTMREKTTFAEAVNLLAAFEKDCVSKPEFWAPLIPDANDMQFLHFRNFAEREGYIFDTAGMAHARPNRLALPADASFTAEDIARADKNLARPDNEFSGMGPMAKTPNTHFLFDQFTQAAHRQNMQMRLNELRVLDILDRFTAKIETAHDKLQQYCKEYHDSAKDSLVTDAETALNFAGNAVKQLRAYGVETTAFDSFVMQCRIICCVLNAQGLYSLMSNGAGDYDMHEVAFKARVTQAVDMLKTIDNRPEAIEMLQNMIVQSPKPEVPAAIGLFVTNYKAERTGYKARSGVPKPPKP